MKFKLVQFLTVGLVTLLVLSPDLVVFNMVWQRHMELVQTKSLVCEIYQSRTSQVELASPQESQKSPQEKEVHSATNFVNLFLTLTKQYKIFQILQWFFVLFPIFLGIVVFLYDRYLIYRTTVFQQQVEMLERLWQSIEQ